MTSKSSAGGRSRIPPRDRFAGIERHFNLDQAFEQLPRESTVRQGHMQKALYRLGPTTTAIFAFEAGGRIDQHTAEGETIIHVLDGQLTVQSGGAAKKTHELGRNDLLLLDPGVPHDIVATRPARMLMTFVLDERVRD